MQDVSYTEMLNEVCPWTELGAIWARVLIVSKGCPTRTWAAPPTLPASNSLMVDLEAISDSPD